MSIKKFPKRAFALEMLVWLFLCFRFSFRFAPVGVRPPAGEAYDIAGKARAQVVNVGLGVASLRICFQISRPALCAWGALVYALRGGGLVTRYPYGNYPIYY